MGYQIKMIIMLFKTNIFALVSYDNKLIIWDDNRRKDLCEFKFNKNILKVKLWRDKIIVVCIDKIFIFNLYNFKQLDVIETGDNFYGIVAISYEAEQILAYPDKETGSIKIKNFKKPSEFNIKNAHLSNIVYLSLSYDGRVLATASEKGTLIRIFNTENGNLLQEVRRGTDEAEIKYICFEPNLRFVAALSGKGTMHIWSLFKTLNILDKIGDKESKEINLIENQTSNFKWLSYLGSNYFNSEWSFAQIREIDPESIFCFRNENTIFILSDDGNYYKYQIDLEKGGDCKKIEEKQFI